MSDTRDGFFLGLWCEKLPVRPEPGGELEFLAPQIEEEYRESRNAISLEIRDSHDILIAN